MKTLFTLIIILLIFKVDACAQFISVQSGFSSTSASYTYKNQDQIDNKSFNSGFQLGVTTDFKLSSNISLIPGVLLQTKGYHDAGNNSDFNLSWDEGFNFWYIDVPVLMSSKFPLDKIDLFAEIGPYTGIGISGKYEYKSTLGNDYYIDKGKFSWGTEDDANLKRIEYGVMARIGAEIRHLKVGLAYTHSLRNIFKEDNYDYKSRVFTLFVSYPIFSVKNAINRQ